MMEHAVANARPGGVSKQPHTDTEAQDKPN